MSVQSDQGSNFISGVFQQVMLGMNWELNNIVISISSYK